MREPDQDLDEMNADPQPWIPYVSNEYWSETMPLTFIFYPQGICNLQQQCEKFHQRDEDVSHQASKEPSISVRNFNTTPYVNYQCFSKIRIFVHPGFRIPTPEII
jgi:hypothetical protein